MRRMMLYDDGINLYMLVEVQLELELEPVTVPHEGHNNLQM
jgi:hypothetical protein